MAFPLNFFFSIFSLITLFSTHINGSFSKQSPISLTPYRMEKTTHLHFFFHDTPDNNKNPTSMRIFTPNTTTSSLFGTIFMADDPLTETPNPGSKIVGKAQGMYGFASQQDLKLLMLMNYAFTEGIYRGSTLSVVGRNNVMESVREMPIVGGSGVFRFARGYALARTISFDAKSGRAVVEYNVSVSHF